MELPPNILKEIEEYTKNLNKEIKKKIYEEVKKRYENSLVDVGEPVGVIAAQSITEPATQLILRSFHFIGVGEKTSQSLPRFLEITDARKKIKDKRMVIRLLEEYKDNREIAEKVANMIKERTLYDISKNILVDYFDKKIIIELNKELIESLGFDFKKLQKEIAHRFKKYKVEIDGNKLIINLEKLDPKGIYLYKEKIKKMQISGIKGIKDVILKYENGEWVIYTYGSNLKEVMKIPYVDYRKVLTNDIKEIEQVLGIEAARAAILNEAYSIYRDQGLEVDIRYFMLLADILTWYGEYLGVTRYGLQAEKQTVLSRGAFEIPIHHFTKASIINERDKINTVVENIMINQIIPIGTGLYDIIYKPKRE